MNNEQQTMNRCSSIVFFLVTSFCFAGVLPSRSQAMFVDEAFVQLKTYRFGQNDEVLNVIREAVVQSYDKPAERQRLARGLEQVLGTDVAYDAKQFACRQLALVGTQEQVPALSKLLADEEMSQMARYALARIPGEATDRALAAALDGTQGRAQLGVINTLGLRRSEIAVNKLESACGGLDSGDAPPRRTAEAAKALGRIGSQAAAQALERVLEKPARVDRTVVADAYLNCADQLAAEGQAERAAKMYEKVMAADLPGHVRATALKGLASAAPSEKVVPHILKALQGGDRDLRNVAAQIVPQIRGSGVTATLAGQLQKLPVHSQVLLINALAVRRDRGSAAGGLPAVTLACRSVVEDVRVAALAAMGDLGDASSVRILAEKAANGAKLEQDAARKSLARLPGEGVNRELAVLLDKADPKVQAQIIDALTARNATETVPALLDTSRSTDGTVRASSVQALRELAGPDHVVALVDMLAAADAQDREAVRKALVAVARRCSVEEQTSLEMIKKDKDIHNPQIKGALLLALGDLGRGSSLPVIRGGLESATGGDDTVRRAAILALGGWPNHEPMNDLLGVAQTDESSSHRVLALRGYVDLVRSANDLSPEEKLQCYKTAMGLAGGVAEKRRVFAALQDVKTLAALEFARSYIGDVELKEEAALATTVIANGVRAKSAGPVKAALEQVAATDVNANTKEQAQKMLDEIDPVRSRRLTSNGVEATKGYLLDWQVAGPYMQQGKKCTELFDIPFGPELPDAQVQWRAMPVSRLDNHIAYLDLLAALGGGEQRVAYLQKEFESGESAAGGLEVFSDDGVKVWLNGQLVHANNVMRPIMPEPDRVNITVKKGVNHPMLKVTQNNLPWGAIVRLKEVRVVEPRVGEGFRLHTLNAESRFEAAGILDVNRDGKPDIFCGGFWYESPTWEKHFVREVTEEGNYHYDFANLPQDVDGDGWTDIIDAAWHNKKVFWVRNPGKNAGAWEVVDIDTPGNIETALAADINGDGRLDVLPNIMSQAAWYEVIRDPVGPRGVKWVKHGLPQQAAGHGIGAGDVNRDGRCDIVASRGWLEQTDDRGDKWQWHQEFDLGQASIPILVHDVDGDGDSDIIWGFGHNYGLFWLESATGGAAGSRTWEKHLIDDSWSQPHYMLLADLNNDGRHELVTGKRYYAHNGNDPGENDPLCVYYYSFDPGKQRWDRRLLHEGGRVGFGINTAAADIDGDGDIDIVAPGKSGLYLFENLLK